MAGGLWDEQRSAQVPGGCCTSPQNRVPNPLVRATGGDRLFGLFAARKITFAPDRVVTASLFFSSAALPGCLAGVHVGRLSEAPVIGESTKDLFAFFITTFN